MKKVRCFWFQRSALPLALALCFSASAQPALADPCATGVSMSGATVAFSPNYDFTDPSQHTTIVTSLRVTGVVDGCSYLVGAEGGNNGRNLSDGSGHTMRYQLYTNSPLTNIFLDPLNGTSGAAANMISFVGGTESTVTLTYYFAIPSSQYISSGLYQDNVLLTLYTGTFLEPSPPVASVSASYEATVTGIFLLSLVPAGGAFNIGQTSTIMDFGNLSPGLSRDIQALFKSNNNTGYRVYMRSDHSSRLKLDGGSPGIPYGLTLSPVGSPNLTDVVTAPLLISTDLQVATGTGAAPATADRLNISATIGNFNPEAEPPGTYSDVVTVTIVGN